MPILTHNEAALVAGMLEAYKTSLEGMLGEAFLKLADTPENRAIGMAVKQRSTDADVAALSGPHLLVSEAGLAEHMRKRLLDAEVDYPVCERCGLECSGEVSDDGTDFTIHKCEECDFQYCNECFFGRHEPDCSVIERLSSCIIAEGAMPES